MEGDNGSSNTVKAKRTCVRTGCVVCRIRKVKCDESLPACFRCTSTGRKCEGYVDPPPIRRKRFSPYPANRRSLSLYFPCEHFSDNFHDCRSFRYFRSRVVESISGCFEFDFWNHFLLQVSHSEPTVHHALLALSSLYEAYATKGRATPESPETRFALKHYTKAVGLLASDLTTMQPSPQAVLVSCLIFVWYEFIQNHLDIALQHLKAGLHILEEAWQTSPVPAVDDSLPRLFTRLHSQARLHGSPTSDFNASISSFKPPTHYEPPRTFTSLPHARSCLDLILGSLYFSHRSLYSPDLSPSDIFHGASPSSQLVLESQRLSLLHSLEDWQAAFDRTPKLFNPAPDDEKTLIGANFLRLHHVSATIMAKTLLEDSEMIFDTFMPEFQKIVSLAEPVIRQTRLDCIGTPIISFDVGVIAPLFLVSLKCRRPLLRRQAIALLKIAPEREGMWLRASCVQYAEFKLAMEEHGCGEILERGEMLPERTRMHSEVSRGIIVDGKRVTVLRFKRGLGDWEEEVTDLSAAMGELL